jgi:hypothetical protein
MWSDVAIVSLLTVIAVVIVLAVTRIAVTLVRRQRLRRRFGSEYERLVDDLDSRSQAEAELALREQYVSRLGVRPLDPAARDRFAAQWATVLDRFARDPIAAIVAAQRLLIAVLKKCGYPVVHREQVMSDLSVDHADLLDHFRSACDIFERNAVGMASDHDLRQAQSNYSALFAELLAEPTDDDDSVASAGSADRMASAGRTVLAERSAPVGSADDEVSR